MEIAKELVKSDEPTAIVLHSDGYANDPSIWSEQKRVMSICETFQGQNVFVNTVAYRQSADFAFLSAMANVASGKCIEASSVKEVYDSLYDTTSTVNGIVMHPIEVPTSGADYVVFLSHSSRRVNGSDVNLTVAGLSPKDDGIVYRYFPVSKQEYDNSSHITDQHGEHILALARAKLSDGRLNEAKLAAYSSCIGVMSSHAKALTGTQLKCMASDIEGYLFKNWATVRSDRPKSMSNSIAVTDILRALEASKDGIMLNLKHLQDNYQPRGIKRVPGVRTDNGIEKPWLELEFTDAGDWVPMGNFEFNSNNATVNLLITRPSRLVKSEDRKPISEVAGINVASLPSFRNYTIIGDGEVVVPKLIVKFGAKEAWENFYKLCPVTSSSEFNPLAEHTILLNDFPVTSFDFDHDISQMRTAFREILGYKVVSGILSAITKDTSVEYTPEQTAELKRHYLSSSLYVNFPTTTEYANLEDALKDGLVDTRVSYKVEIGDKGILNTGRLYSANEFLARHFMAIGGAKASDKPKWPMFLDANISFQVKPPSSRMQLSEVDSFCRPIFEEFLGLSTNGSVKNILAAAGIDKSVMDIVRGGIKTMTEVQKAVENKMNDVYKTHVMPFVFFVGATGLLPDCFDAKGVSADELESQITGLKIGKTERDGTFFCLDDIIVSVYAKNEYFSTKR